MDLATPKGCSEFSHLYPRLLTLNAPSVGTGKVFKSFEPRSVCRKNLAVGVSGSQWLQNLLVGENSHNKQRLHKVGYFKELITTNQDVHESIRPLLKLSREMISRSQKLDYALISSLESDLLLKERLRRLRTVPGVGPITAVTWALEIGDFTRFTSNKQAISYCGLCGDEKSSADKIMRMPSGTSISSAC
jgi:hypothetical protein